MSSCLRLPSPSTEVFAEAELRPRALELSSIIAVELERAFEIAGGRSVFAEKPAGSALYFSPI
jgi:hypothetical protein